MDNLLRDNNNTYLLPQMQFTVNYLTINQNHSLITCATNKGYKIFEAYNFIQVSEDDEIMDLIGPLKFATVFYESYLIGFIGMDDNFTFPSNQLVLYDDNKKRKLGVVILKDKIERVFITKYAIFIAIFDKVLVFDTIDLTYLFTLEDVDVIKNPALSYENNPGIFVNIGQSRKNQIKITKSNLY